MKIHTERVDANNYIIEVKPSLIARMIRHVDQTAMESRARRHLPLVVPLGVSTLTWWVSGRRMGALCVTLVRS